MIPSPNWSKLAAEDCSYRVGSPYYGLRPHALGFAAAAHNTLHLSVRIGTAQSRAEDLAEAMQSRTVINLGCGVITAQNRCSQADAMEILANVSSPRNRTLREVATELSERLTGNNIQTHFEA